LWVGIRQGDDVASQQQSLDLAQRMHQLPVVTRHVR
jgi:hypothetical protein